MKQPNLLLIEEYVADVPVRKPYSPVKALPPCDVQPEGCFGIQGTGALLTWRQTGDILHSTFAMVGSLITVSPLARDPARGGKGAYFFAHLVSLNVHILSLGFLCGLYPLVMSPNIWSAYAKSSSLTGFVIF